MSALPSAASATAAILVIGNEILSGKVTDLNSPFLCKELRALGVSLRRIEVVPDEIDVIAEAVARLSQTYDHVFTSGGIGPTHDDKTIEAVAQAFEAAVEQSPLLVELLEQWYGDTLNEARLRMALVPAGAEIAHGGDVKIPVVFARNVMILPGVPELFRKAFRPLRERFLCHPYHCRRAYVTVMEGDIADLLTRIERDHESVDVGSYPVFEADSPYRVMLTFDSKSADAAQAALNAFLSEVPAAGVYKVE
ncbi:MAG: competence/damage-inducible protein A [Proteobacteria bacterium]|nr:competence/damage-inducible protein A [Pseudomonadota bacterium]